MSVTGLGSVQGSVQGEVRTAGQTPVRVKRHRAVRVLAGAVASTLLLTATPGAMAQSAIQWAGGNTGVAEWTTAANWAGGAFPGVLAGTPGGNTGDVAVFDNTGGGSNSYGSIGIDLTSGASLTLGAIRNATNAGLTLGNSTAVAGLNTRTLVLTGAAVGTGGITTSNTIIQTDSTGGITFQTNIGAGATTTGSPLAVSTSVTNAVINNSSAVAFSTVAFTASAGLIKNGTGTVSFNGSSNVGGGSVTVSNGLTVNAGRVSLGAIQTATFTGGVSVTGGDFTTQASNWQLTGGINVTGGSATLQGGTASFSGGARVSGGALTLANGSTASTFTGGATVSGTGTLLINSGGALGQTAAGNVLLYQGGFLDNSSSTINTAQTLNANVPLNVSNSTIIYSGSTSRGVLIGGTTTFNGVTAANPVQNIDVRGGTFGFSGLVQTPIATTRIVKTGSGLLYFSGSSISSTYSGGVLITNGGLQFNGSSIATANVNTSGVLSAGSFGTGPVTFAATGGNTIRVTATSGQADLYANQFRVESDVTFGATGAARVTLAGRWDLGGANRVFAIDTPQLPWFTLQSTPTVFRIGTINASNVPYTAFTPSNGSITFLAGPSVVAAGTNSFAPVYLNTLATFTANGSVTLGSQVLFNQLSSINGLTDLTTVPRFTLQDGAVLNIAGSPRLATLSGSGFVANIGSAVTGTTNSLSAGTTTLNILGVPGVTTTSTFSGRILEANDALAIIPGMSQLSVGAGAGTGQVGLSLSNGFNGLLILTGSNGYGGNTSINGGALQVGNGGATGNINFANGSTISGGINGTLIFNRSTDFTVGSNGVSLGTVVQNGSNTVTVTGGFRAADAGGYFLNRGLLQIGTPGDPSSTVASTGNALVQVNSPGAITYSRANSLFVGQLSGNGTVTVNNTAPNISFSLVSNNPGFNGTLVVQQGDARLGNGTNAPIGTGAIGTATVSVGATGSLTIYRTDTYTFSNTVTGPGTFNLGQSGTTTVTGTVNVGNFNASTGLLIIGPTASVTATNYNVFSNGTLDASQTAINGVAVPAGGNLGINGIFIGANILNEGNVNVGGGSVSYTLASNISGGGSLSKGGSNQGTGQTTTTLTGALTYRGNTSIGGGLITFTTPINAAGGTVAATGLAGAFSTAASSISVLDPTAYATAAGNNRVATFGAISIGDGTGVASTTVTPVSPFVGTSTVATRNTVIQGTSLSFPTNTTTGVALSGVLNLGYANLVLRNDGNGTNAPVTSLTQANAYAAAFISSGGTLGLGSSLANPTGTGTNPYTGLAVFSNNDGFGNPFYSSYAGVGGLTASSLIFKLTYLGDTNLDGVLDGTDFANVIEGLSIPGATGWLSGDFDYSGTVTVADLGLFLNAYNYYNANPATRLSFGNGSGELFTATGAVPEPASLGLLAAAVPMLSRRRRTR